jgi:hypothetical protein
MGGRAHHFILKYIDQLEGAIVEIGAGRGEGSTDFFAGLVSGHKKFQHHSIDFDPDAVSVCETYANKISNSNAYCMTGEQFLTDVFPKLNQKICYAYLDNFDYNYSPADMPWWIPVQQQRYRELGVEMTNENSEKAHLDQTMLLHPYVADKCIIQLDDTYKVHNEWKGKGARAVPWLLDHNWKDVYSHDHSIALINF